MRIKGIVIGALMILALMPFETLAQESKFKALFISKFAEYIEWPSGDKNLTVGIAGDSEVYKELSNFAASKENLTVINIKSADESSKCHIIFLPKSKDGQISAFDSAIGSKSILLVSDNSALVGNGSDIGFYIENGRLRFLISVDEIRAKNMTPSTKLVTLGKTK